MSEPFLSEIRLMGFNFNPRGWALCNGVLLSINQYQSLFSLLGTMYGGDGRTTFGLPDLQGRVPLGLPQSGPQQGAKSGAETVALTSAEVPPHTHTMNLSVNATATNQTGADAVFATPPASVGNIYSAAATPVDTPLSSAAISPTGGSPHDNMMPSLALNWCICINGVFPSRN